MKFLELYLDYETRFLVMFPVTYGLLLLTFPVNLIMTWIESAGTVARV